MSVQHQDYIKLALGKPIRILFGSEKNEFRSLIWVEVGKDGSIYLGPRYNEASYQSFNSVTPENGEVFIPYDEGEIIEDPSILKTQKVSFHASGQTNAGGKRSVSSSLREIEDKKLICNLFFQHPKEFPVPQGQRKTDIRLNYLIDDNRPLLCNVYAHKLRNSLDHSFTSVDCGGTYQHSINLIVKEMNGVSDMAIQLAFYHGPEGDWPTATRMGWYAELKGEG